MVPGNVSLIRPRERKRQVLADLERKLSALPAGYQRVLWPAMVCC